MVRHWSEMGSARELDLSSKVLALGSLINKFVVNSHPSPPAECRKGQLFPCTGPKGTRGELRSSLPIVMMSKQVPPARPCAQPSVSRCAQQGTWALRELNTLPA